MRSAKARRRWSARHVAVAGCSLVAATAAIALVAGQHGASGRRTVAATVLATSHRLRSRGGVAPGISLEYDTLRTVTGPPGARDEAFVRLVRRLARASGTAPDLRFGGNSTDQSWWNPRGAPRPPTVLFDLTPATLRDIAWLARRTGAHVTLGLNLALDDPQRALAFARAVRRRLPGGALRALEIGNEPDLFATQRTFRVGGRVLRRLRKRAAYGPTAYTREVRRYLVALRRGLRPAPRLLVGALAGDAWLPRLGDVVHRLGGLADGISAHLYGLRDCASGRGAGARLGRLLDPASTQDVVRRLQRIEAVARPAGLAVPVTELNSAVCGGAPGVSDTLAGSLWLADALLAVRRAGAAVADVHTWPGAYYAAFGVGRDAAGRPTARPRPAYAAMLLAAAAEPAGSRVADVRLDRHDDHARIWATRAPDGTVRVLVLNLADAPLAVSLRVAGGGCGTLRRLDAATLRARSIRLDRAVRSCPARGARRVGFARAGAALLVIPR